MHLCGVLRQRLLETAKLMIQLLPTEDDTAGWEDEGGALGQADCPLAVKETAESSSKAVQPDLIAEQAGATIHQAEWADQIRARVAAELDRAAQMLEVVAGQQPEQDRKDTQDVIAILGQKRAELMARNDAGRFIHDWQELRGQVRQMILQDPRCQPLKAQQFSTLPQRPQGR